MTFKLRLRNKLATAREVGKKRGEMGSGPDSEIADAKAPGSKCRTFESKMEFSSALYLTEDRTKTQRCSPTC